MQNDPIIEIVVSILPFLTFTRILLCHAFSFCCCQVSVLYRACIRFLIESLDLSNCLSLFSIAEAYGSDSLLRSATEFVIQNFCNLSKMQDFLNMQVLPSLMPSFEFCFKCMSTRGNWARKPKVCISMKNVHQKETKFNSKSLPHLKDE